MKKHLVILTTLLLAFVSPLSACDDEEAQAYLIDEILRLSHEGVPDRIIITQMRTMDFVFCLTADDIIELRELGVSDDVLEAIIETSLEVEAEREYREPNVYVRVSPGYWSPWYRYPSGWGFYYDPFPNWYSWHYYPVLYNCGVWYGWWPSTYYYAYHWYDVYNDYSPHTGNYNNDPVLQVKRQRDAQLVAMPPQSVPSAGIIPAAARPGRPTTTAAGDRGRLKDHVDGGSLVVRRTGDGWREITVAPERRANRDVLREAKSDDLSVRQPATPVRAAPTPRTQPGTQPARTPSVDRSGPSPAQPPAVERSRPRRVETNRRSTPVRRYERPSTNRSTKIGQRPQRNTRRVTPTTKRTSRPKSFVKPKRNTSRVTTPPPKRTNNKRSFTQPRTAPPRATVKAPPVRRSAPAPRPAPRSAPRTGRSGR